MSNAPLGILMLDTHFPRIRGDGGNAESYPFPVLIQRVRGASVERAVRSDPMALLAPFIRGGEALVSEGCCAITTTCGFLAPLQEALSSALRVPVATSALLECERAAHLTGGPIGVLTIAASALTPTHLRAARVPENTPIATVEGGSFARSILRDGDALDVKAARDEHVTAAAELVRKHPTIRAIVLECANMPPYADAIAAETERPVFTVLTMAAHLREGAIRSRTATR